MEPTEKDEKMEKFLIGTFGFDRRESIKNNVCLPKPMGCGEPATNFRDPLSTREYTISGFCQACQDRVFGLGE